MRAGALRTGCVYREPTEAVGKNRGRTLAWADRASLFAEVRTPNGREYAHAAGLKLDADLTHVVRHRHPGFLPGPAGRYEADDGRVLNVLWSADPDERGAEVVSYCASQPLGG